RRHTRWPSDWSSDVCSSDLCNFDGRLEIDVLEGVETLVSNNLLQPGFPSGERETHAGDSCEQRFRMLETIYEYAREKLEESGERSEEHTSELQSRGHIICRL